MLKIGLLGSGRIGGTLGKDWAKAGQGIFFSSRHPEKLRKLAQEAGNRAHVGTLEEAANFGEIALLAIPWRKKEELPSSDLFREKMVIDAMNPYSPFGGIIDLGHTTSSEEVAKLLPGARLVKAFNTLSFAHLQTEAFRSGRDRRVIFVSGEDQEAKRVVSHLVEDIGLAPVNTGSLREGGRWQQPGSPIYNKPLTEEQARLASISHASAEPLRWGGE